MSVTIVKECFKKNAGALKDDLYCPMAVQLFLKCVKVKVGFNGVTQPKICG